MKKLNINEWIAVFAGIAFVAFLFYGASFMDLFNIKPVTQVSQNLPQTGVLVSDLKVGEGAEAKPGDILSVHYVGMLTDGKVFDSSIDRGMPIEFTLGAGQVIRGWEEGLVGIKEGGRRRLVIAPDYAYGSQGNGPIPPNAVLIFDVELVKIGGQTAGQ